MQSFNKTLTLLNSLIERLQANTGGQKIEVVPVKAKVKNMPKQNQPQKKQNPGQKQQEKKQKKEKKEKKKETQEKKQEKPVQQKKEDGEIGVEVFAQIDIRIGEIVECWKHPDSQKLYCEKINIGGEVREIASGLQEFVPHEDMKGLVIVMANLKPRPLAKFMSNGMVVCASNNDHTQVHIIRPEGKISERVFLDGYQQLFQNEQILPVINPKRKILEKCLPLFNTDEQGFVIWKGIRLRTSGGFLKSQIKSGSVS